MTSTITRRTLLGAGAATVPLALAGTANAAQQSSRPRSPLEGVTPTPRTHAHNDYEHVRPLFDALGQGFVSVEADIWLVGGELYIGHDGPDLTRTLRGLYLDPLARLAKAGRGWIYPGHRVGLQLLIDVKSPGDPVWPVLQRQLASYRGLFTYWRNGRRHPGPVTAVLSGELAQRTSTERLRWAGFDGRLRTPLPAGATPEQLPLLSDNWALMFTWQGVGPMPPAERARLQELVAAKHSAGYQVRFWNTPDLPGPARTAVWTELWAAGVDYLNTDDLAGLREFVRAQR
ncbi:hypothetical protein HJ588_14830 [Flexivirga sp. ID2601S]|uniref:Altered inheritance of mitochondria protein 6 n=1 Tax=Flexivirga aerilata TaxID=1656889 RepID=A0A849AQG5_9MICO|nr:phosphatidylinositol-specific phospholipase C/glycerophosphodiester phosphodiesterase family protein [Flexivirga aerilata]NNG40540.1 hypothetical protein [Flexivirga aerilata]